MIKKIATKKPIKIDEYSDKVLDLEQKSFFNETIKNIKQTFSGCFDFVVQEFSLNNGLGNAVVCYLHEYIEVNEIQDFIKYNFYENNLISDFLKCNIIAEAKDLIPFISSPIKLTPLKTEGDIQKSILDGRCVILLENINGGIEVYTKKEQIRSIDDSTVEPTVRGPKESFIESIEPNVRMIRKRIKSTSLKTEKFILGRVSKTEIVIVYLDSLSEMSLVDEIKSRIQKVDVDVILDSGDLESLIKDDPFVIFPQMFVTERPDRCVLAINEGRVVLLIDGSPMAIIIPSTINNFLESTEDRYVQFYYSSFIRLIRYFALITSIFAPSIYVAFTTYHPEMIPTNLLITVAASRAEVPFPAIMEAFLMELTFELLREAGERLAKNMGQTLSIVGALVIGQTAVQAGLVSQVMVIVVSITALSSFAIPTFNLSRQARVLRFPVMILSGILGGYGITISGIFLIMHLASVRTFGVPYLTPFAPLTLASLKNSIIHFPLWMINKRPSEIQKKNERGIKENAMPRP